MDLGQIIGVSEIMKVLGARDILGSGGVVPLEGKEEKRTTHIIK